MSSLDGEAVNFVFPVTLSRALRRDVLVRTGVEPAAAQLYVPEQFTALAPALRSDIVETWEKINVHVDEEERHFEDGEPYVEIVGARNDGYLWLQRNSQDRWTRYLPSNGDSIDVDDVFFPAAGRTVGALAELRSTLDEDEMEALDAMLAGAPLVEQVGESNALLPDEVLRAYERALTLAQRLIEFVDGGARGTGAWLFGAFEITDKAIFLYPEAGETPPNRPAAILKKSSPQAYQQARELLEQIGSAPKAIVTEKIDRVCFHWWSSLYAIAPDERKVEALLKTAVTNVLSDVRGQHAQQEAAERYEQLRAAWIATHGSQRLKRAAARGYRHDGIYRDERLQSELPGFVTSLGRKAVIRELVNPSEDALELEAEVLARADALGIAEENVRLVWAQPGQDSDWSEGAFVQIEGYLGRHTVWQSVSGERDVLPF